MLHPRLSESMIEWDTWRILVTDSIREGTELKHELGYPKMLVQELQRIEEIQAYVHLIVIGVWLVILCLAILNIVIAVKRRK